MTPANLIPPKQFEAYHITDGVRNSIGFFYFAANRWFDYYSKIEHVSAWRELTEQEQVDFKTRQRKAIASDKRYAPKDTTQINLFQNV